MELVKLLRQFGFTEVEARVYIGLCEGGAATGYELAKALQITRANVYAALEDLVAKGAAEKTPTTPVRYAPVAPDALVDRLTQRTTQALAALRAGLPRPTPPRPDEFWVITGQEPILAKAVELIGDAKREIMADIWSEEGPALLPALEMAHARGIRVTLITIGPLETCLPRVYRHNREEVWALDGRSLTLVVDRGRMLVGTIGGPSSTASGSPGSTTSGPGRTAGGSPGAPGRAVVTADPTLVDLADNALFHDLLVLELQRRLGLSDADLYAVEEAIRGKT
jgi:sugar-specific transcriptional regulator TrmB